MTQRLLTFILLFSITGIAWFINNQYAEAGLDKVFYSLVAITSSYLVLKILFESAISKQVKDAKARYSFRKTTHLLFIFTAAIVILRVWIPNPQALLVAYGLFAAGVAIALQDVFKNVAGTIAIFTSSIYRVGDRVQINSKFGDVIDIGISYTTLIELREWVDGDQTTGRIVLVPNGQVLSSPVQNYTKDHSFIWDEISLSVTYNSNWQKAVELIQEIITEHTAEATKRAEHEISRLEEKYYLSKRNMEPAIFVTPTDNWVMLRARYVVDVRDRRLVNSDLLKLILTRITESDDIVVASQTLSVSSPLIP